ncbi:MAG: M23 family peptidase, partial [Flavisolibacter sp.]|nr:M23 family peptidase [Flavisolibacter sp.]
KTPRLVFTPRDNFNTIKSFRAEIDGQWLRFTNDKSRTGIYKFDEHFPPGVHELKVMVEVEAGNISTKTWWCRR